MSNRALLTIVLLLGASTLASAQNAPTALVDIAFVVPPPATVHVTFVELHSARVENDLLLFKPTLVGIAPVGPSARNAALVERAPAKKQIRFFVPAEGGDGLEVRRDRDRLVLFRGPQSQGAAFGIGMVMFAATTILSAHAPRPLRVVFDGPVHLGPAIFDGGGMGAGIAGRGL